MMTYATKQTPMGLGSKAIVLCKTVWLFTLQIFGLGYTGFYKGKGNETWIQLGAYARKTKTITKARFFTERAVILTGDDWALYDVVSGIHIAHPRPDHKGTKVDNQDLIDAWDKRRELIAENTLRDAAGDHKCWQCGLFEDKSQVCAIMISRGRKDPKTGLALFENVPVKPLNHCIWKDHLNLIEDVDFEKIRNSMRQSEPEEMAELQGELGKLFEMMDDKS